MRKITNVWPWVNWKIASWKKGRVIFKHHFVEIHRVGTFLWQAWHAWAVMNFEAVLHYKHQNQVRDEKKKLRHASGASANSEASNSDSEVDSTDQSPVPSPGQKKVSEVGHKKGSFVFHQLLSVIRKCTQQINKIFKGFWKNVTYHF